MEAVGVQLDDYVNGKMYYGVKTGCNVAFVINGDKRGQLIDADPRSAEVIKPLAVGDDIRKWRIDYQDQWLIYSPWDLQIDKYPAIKKHLLQWKTQLQNRPECRDGRYKWWCMARYGAEYRHTFDQPKIIFPDIAKESRFAFDQKKTYITNTTYFISSNDFYLLGVLNSHILWAYAKARLSVLGDAEDGGRLRFFRQFVEKMPVPDAPLVDRTAIASLVQKCIDAKGQGPEVTVWEAEIDARVARLYGLTEADAAAIEGPRAGVTKGEEEATA